MASFTYKGEDKEGKTVTETVTAADRFAVYAMARQSGHTVTSIKESSTWSFKKYFDVEKINYYISRVSSDEIVMVTIS